jgi:undecaprenyl-diphosphatase
VNPFEAVVLGIIQGLTEFLPISSSAHLRIFGDLFGWGDPGAAFPAVVQIGTEIAVLVYFRHKIWSIIRTWTLSLFRPALRGELDARMGWYVILGSIPIAILGVAFEDQIQTLARDLRLIAATLIIMGIVLFVADRFGSHTVRLDELALRDALLFGLAQACALVPGVSRSGATISMGLALGYRRQDAAEYAFLLAVPAVLGSGLFQLPDVAALGRDVLTEAVIAGVVAFVLGYVTIAWLMRYVSTHNYTLFVAYRITLGVAVIVMLGTGVLAPR